MFICLLIHGYPYTCSRMCLCIRMRVCTFILASRIDGDVGIIREVGILCKKKLGIWNKKAAWQIRNALLKGNLE